MSDTHHPYEPWRSGTPGRTDVDGVEWWACDPYPCWYRRDADGNLIERRFEQDPAEWADEWPEPWAFPDVDAFNEMFREAATSCNGMLYHGDRLEAQITFIKWMRVNPRKARVLLADYGPVPPARCGVTGNSHEPFKCKDCWAIIEAEAKAKGEANDT